jgi:hypothetical protein
VLDYLHSRGYTAAEKILRESIEATGEKGKQPETVVSAEDFLRTLAVYAQKASKPGENVLKDSANVLQELTAMGNPSSIQNLIASLGSVGAEELLSLDPMDKQEGFRELEAWVEGSLDMYRVRSVSIRIFTRRVITFSLILARIPPHPIPHFLSFLSRSYRTRFQGSRFSLLSP